MRLPPHASLKCRHWKTSKDKPSQIKRLFHEKHFFAFRWNYPRKAKTTWIKHFDFVQSFFYIAMANVMRRRIKRREKYIGTYAIKEVAYPSHTSLYVYGCVFGSREKRQFPLLFSRAIKRIYLTQFYA